jgi:predicted TIM-barrel fold metal-dependent hydrolase
VQSLRSSRRATRLDEFVPQLQALPVPYVIDHTGVVDASPGLEQSAFGHAAVARGAGREVLG